MYLSESCSEVLRFVEEVPSAPLSSKKKKSYERASGAELLDLVFDNAVVPEQVNLRKIT